MGVPDGGNLDMEMTGCRFFEAGAGETTGEGKWVRGCSGNTGDDGAGPFVAARSTRQLCILGMNLLTPPRSRAEHKLFDRLISSFPTAAGRKRNSSNSRITHSANGY